MRKLIISLMFVVCLIMMACNDNKEREPTVISPIHFEKDAYTVMAFYGASISYSGGGGIYKLSASNPEVLGKFGMDIETHRLIINPTTTGESTLTVYDVETDSSVTLNITVEDFHLSFSVDEISGENVNYFIKVGDEIRYIRGTENTKQINVLRETDGKKNIIAAGNFDIVHKDRYVYVMDMTLHSPLNEETSEFEYTIGGDADCLRIFETYFWFNWSNDDISSRSQWIRSLTMTLKDESINYCITTELQPF
ncbi:MAG: hypothetical protein K2L17_05555 [Muribaculaceae bacterium]|nr:hypothetical protein [Muribaculaceae bacterium]